MPQSAIRPRVTPHPLVSCRRKEAPLGRPPSTRLGDDTRHGDDTRLGGPPPGRPGENPHALSAWLRDASAGHRHRRGSSSRPKAARWSRPRRHGSHVPGGMVVTYQADGSHVPGGIVVTYQAASWSRPGRHGSHVPGGMVVTSQMQASAGHGPFTARSRGHGAITARSRGRDGGPAAAQPDGPAAHPLRGAGSPAPARAAVARGGGG